MENFMNTIGTKLRILERQIDNELKGEISCCGVTLSQCHIIMELNKKGQTSIKELADLLGLDKSTMSRSIDSLVESDFVLRIENKFDRRYCDLSLTETGLEKAFFINKASNSFYSNLLNEIPVEKHSMIVESINLLVDTLNKKLSGGSCCKK